jgi:putative endonuclease
MAAMNRRVPFDQFTDPRHLTGVQGELAALTWLAARGWTIEAHRYRFGRHDLDLVIRRGSLVAFVEVKTRRGSRHGAPGEAIGWKKRRALALGSRWWRREHGRPGDQYRFDLVSVDLAPGGPRLDHLEDAWRESV